MLPEHMFLWKKKENKQVWVERSTLTGAVYVYVIAGVTVKVYVADMERETIIEPPVSVRAYLVQTVEEFKTLVAQVSIIEM